MPGQELQFDLQKSDHFDVGRVLSWKRFRHPVKVEGIMKRVLIGGIGNVLAGDDGVGPYTVRLLDSRYDFFEGVEVADLGTPGLDLAADLSTTDAVILVDSVRTGEPAGSVTLYRKEDMLRHRPALTGIDAHSLALTESLFLADMVGRAPEDLLLIGISGQQFDSGPGLSEPVRKAVDHAILLVIVELDRLGVQYANKGSPAQAKAWWEPLRK